MFGLLRKLLVCSILLSSILIPYGSYGKTPTPTESSHNKQAQAPQSQQPTATDQRGTDKVPLVIKVIPTPQSEEDAANERKDREDRSTNERLLIGANIVLAIFTAILAIFTGKMWWDSGKTAERQLRPYVALHITAEGYPPSAPDRFAVYLVVTNAGKTWARHLKIQFAMIPQECGDGNDPFDLMEKNISLSPMILGPGQSLKLQFGDITRPVVLAVANKLFQRSYVGLATYKDTLSPSVIIRQTQISCRLNGDLQGGVSFSYMPTHNCADEDCA